MYKLVVIDLDNTLLNSSQKISEKNKETIKKVQQKGIEVMIATGRMFVSAYPFLKELGLENEVIVYNGSMVKNIKANKIICHNPIKKEYAKEIVKDIKSKDLHINLYQNDKLYVDKDNEYKRRYEEISGVNAIQVDNLDQFDFDAPTKLLIIEDDREKHQYYHKYLKETYNDIIDVTESKEYFIEIGAKGVNKGRTLQKIIQTKGIRQDEIIAIGDSYNDLEMLSFAHIGVAMENSAQKIKDMADVIAPHHENDGVAVILDKLILN